MFWHRPVTPEDYERISSFPQNDTELFYMYPSAAFPLTPEQIERNVACRFHPTVIVHEHDGRVAGFANLYDVEEGRCCWLGNVIVAPEFRGQGAAAALIRAMIGLARDGLKVPKLRLCCHNTNTAGLLFYTKLGFVPYSIEKRRIGSRTVACVYMETGTCLAEGGEAT